MRSCILGFAITGYTLFCTPCIADQTGEPPQKMVLQIDGRQAEFVVGEKLKLTGAFSDPTIQVVSSPTRQFSYGGINFEYPANFVWDAETDGDAYRSWTMSGNECTIMYFTFANELTADVFAASLREQFGQANSTIESVSRRLGGLRLEGKRVVANIAGNRMAQDVLNVPAPTGKSRLLVLQDVPDEEGVGLEEAKRVHRLLSESFRLAK